jgi:hypothetical protein
MMSNYDEFENSGRTLEQDTPHRGVNRTPEMTRSLLTEAPKDPDAETEISATAELGYN